MRRGSVSTYVDDGRRHSGMPIPESQNENRQEFTVNDIDYERTGGCFVSYRKIAFAFVFLLALVIAAAFIGVYIGSPPDKDVPDALSILSNEETAPDKYVLSSSIKPLSYRIEIEPRPQPANGTVALSASVVIEFSKSDAADLVELVLNAKHLTIKRHRLFALDANATREDEVRSQRNAGVENEKKIEKKLEEKNDGETQANNSTSSDIAPVDHHLHHVEEPVIGSHLNISANKTDEADGTYVLFLEKSLQEGNYSLEIEYEAMLDERVIYMVNYTTDNKNKLFLVSKLKPVNAPRLFPTFDESKLKASFALTVLRLESSRVLSNMPLAYSVQSSKELIADRFTATPPMSAHNLAFVSGDLHSLETVKIGTNLTIDWWAGAERNSAESYFYKHLTPAIGILNDFFGGIGPPTERINLAVLPVDLHDLSTPGLIVVRESVFNVTSDEPPYARATVLRRLVGVLGQQWLGGLVDAKNWTDAWYLEGSLVYLKFALAAKIDLSIDMSGDFLVYVQQKIMENDGYMISKPLNSNVNRTRIEAFDLADKYRKGACLIMMIHAAMNESAFKSGYVEFLQRWSYTSADSNEFLRTLTGNTTIEGESINLYEAFVSWTRNPGYPMINVTWDRENNTVTIQQTRFTYGQLIDEDEEEEEVTEANELLWWVPLTYVTDNSDWSAPEAVWLKGKKEIILKNVTSTNNNWIIFNVNRTGYYRVNYDEASWRELAARLREKHEEIPEKMRASLIDDALSLARQGSLNYDDAFSLLLYLGPSERHYIPWKTLAIHARQLDFALYDTSAYPGFQEFMQKLVSKLFDEMKPKFNEGSALANLAIQLACSYEYQECTSMAKNLWQDVLNENGDTKLSEQLRKTVYCVGAQRGGQEELTYLMRKFAETSTREEKDQYLSAFGCFQAPWILQKILIEILQTNKYENNDIKVILRSYAKNPAAAQVVRRFVQKNWKDIVKRFSKSYWTMKAFVEASTSNLFTDFDLKEFNSFRDENIESLKSMGHWVALNEMKASSWISRLKETSGTIQKWFKNHTSSLV